jgi:predicted dehydrogenase
MLNTRSRIGALILGCGWAARIHSRTLARLGGVELFYASRDAARAETFRRQYHGRQAFGSYAAGLAHRDVDVAILATPTSTHYELTKLALDAEKDVIVEKPAFMSSTELDRVNQIAHERGRRVLVAENYFYKPIADQLRRLIADGELGDVRFVTLNATRQRSWAGWRGDAELSGGGALFEAGIHWINFASNLGLEVESISAERVGAANEVDRSSLVIFRYVNGAVGTLAHSWELAAPLGGLRLSKVQGTHGAVTFESNGFAYVQTGRKRKFWVPISRDPLGYWTMMQDFFRAIRSATAARFTLEMARGDLMLLEAAEASMRGAEIAM